MPPRPFRDNYGRLCRCLGSLTDMISLPIERLARTRYRRDPAIGADQGVTMTASTSEPESHPTEKAHPAPVAHPTPAAASSSAAFTPSTAATGQPVTTAVA